MIFEPVIGYPEEIDYCPFCGEEVGEVNALGCFICNSCRAKFYVVEDDESERDIE